MYDVSVRGGLDVLVMMYGKLIKGGTPNDDRI